mmetsp:Transcript_4315/g.7295  ORF Transcript_4315/g.7295 Transcript_4315/m.7295 type:complete len:104 (-) Transcript_4315:1895-2206(-)
MHETTGEQSLQKILKGKMCKKGDQSDYLTFAENCVEWVIVTSTELFRCTSVENCQEEYVKALRCCSSEASSEPPQASLKSWLLAKSFASLLWENSIPSSVGSK